MEKIVSQLDSKGYFVASVVADESPLEPGVFHIPGGAVDVPAPKNMREGKRYRLNGNTWVEEEPALPESAPTQEPLTDAQRIAAATARRDSLLSYATLRIGPLQDVVEFGMATGDEKDALAIWRRYRVDVSRVDVGAESPEWPEQPNL